MNSIVRSALTIALLGGAGAGLVEGARRLVREDPFANLRARPTPGISDDTGLLIGRANVRTYVRGELMAKATVGGAEIAKDRGSLTFRGVTNGWYRSDRGPVAFTARGGEYVESGQRLELRGGATAKNKDLDVKTDRAAFDGLSRVVSFPTPLNGRVGPGYGKVVALRYALDDGSFSSGAAEWEGKLRGTQEPTFERRPWRITSQSTRGSGRSNVRVMVNATATDGEVLLRAPLVEHDTKEDVIVATGRVFYYSGSANMVADKVTVYQREKRAVAVGNVTMLVKPKRTEDGPLPKIQAEPIPDLPDEPTGPLKAGKSYGPTTEEKALDEKLRSGKSLREYPLSVATKKVQYWYKKGERRAIFEGQPRAFQSFPRDRWRRIDATAGKYDGEGDKLTLQSLPGKVDTRLRTSIGDDLVTDWVVVSTKEGEDDYETGVLQGVVQGEPEEKKPDDKKPTKKGGGV